MNHMLLLVTVFSFAPKVFGHSFDTPTIRLTETEAGLYQERWKPPLDSLRVQMPTACSLTDDVPTVSPTATSLRAYLCPEGIRGNVIRIVGLDGVIPETLAVVTLSDGTVLSKLLTVTNPTWQVPREKTSLQAATAFLILGVEHIIFGWDHLVFVAGLMLLCTSAKNILSTVTAFTLGHSVTLCLSVLGFLTFPVDWVEACIALSIVLVAQQVLKRRQQVPGDGNVLDMQRWPEAALIALIFGLIHGMGFAAVLAEIGFQPSQMALSLASFNLGVEAGQLLFCTFFFLLSRLIRSEAQVLHLRYGLAYAMGVLGCFWLFDRTVTMMGGM